jgi:AcrR family transcriptional regulator
MRTAIDTDLTAKARIRDTAMALFATNGVAATPIRVIARTAGVSPGLVIHHFGSKGNLVAAVDDAVVRRITSALSEVPIEGSGAEVVRRRTDQVAALLKSQPTVCDYIARALLEGSDASADLFARMFASARRDEALLEAGAIRPDADPFWRTMHQLVLMVGPLMLRPLIERELGESLLDDGQLERWMAATVDLLQHGLYADTALNDVALQR